MEHLDSSAAPSSNMDRRKALKVGTAGVAAAGILAAGGPKVLGLGTAPAYAAGSSSTGPTTTTLAPPTTGDIDVVLGLWDGLNPALRPTIPIAIGPHNVNVYSDAAGTTLAQSVPATGNVGDNFIAFSFTNLTPGDYWVDIDEPMYTLGETGTLYMGTPVTVAWNYRNVAEPWYPVIARYQQVTVTAGGTATLDLAIQVRVPFAQRSPA